MLLEVKVVAGYRFAEFPIRLSDGTKVYIGKEEPTTIDTKDLTKGGEFTLRRYEEEGRFIIEEVEAEAEGPVASFACGASTVSGGTCRRPVGAEGERCHQHAEEVAEDVEGRLMALGEYESEAVAELALHRLEG